MHVHLINITENVYYILRDFLWCMAWVSWLQNTVELVQSDIWVFGHPTKIYGHKVFLLTKTKPEYCDISLVPWCVGLDRFYCISFVKNNDLSFFLYVINNKICKKKKINNQNIFLSSLISMKTDYFNYLTLLRHVYNHLR